jgi:hypothetical protein
MPVRSGAITDLMGTMISNVVFWLRIAAVLNDKMRKREICCNIVR